MAEPALRVYDVYDGESWWIVATSEEDVLRIAREKYEIPTDPDEPAVVENVLADDALLTIRWEDDPRSAKLPEGATLDGMDVTATGKAWAEWGGAGAMIGGTCW